MRPGEALWEILMIFRVPLGSGGAPFWLKKASFLGVLKFDDFGVREGSIFGRGRRHERAPW